MVVVPPDAEHVVGEVPFVVVQLRKARAAGAPAPTTRLAVPFFPVGLSVTVSVMALALAFVRVIEPVA
jgi:hypothetical protein